MRQFENKRKLRKLIYSKFTIVILLFLLFLLARGTFRVYEKAKESNFRENSSAVSLAELEKRKDNLNKKIDRLDSRVGIEEELRTRYSFSKEGEHAVVIIGDEEPIKKEVEKKGIIKKTMSWFQKLNLLK